MLDFSFGELVLVGLVALLVVGPRDMPVVLRAVGRWFGQFKSIADEFRTGFKSAMQEASFEGISQDLRAINEEAQYIKDEKGNLQRVYDISDFMDEQERNTKVTPTSVSKTPEE